MKTLLKCMMVALIACIATANVFTQEWTKAQLEIWQVVEDSWIKMQADDIEGLAANLHEKYQGWNDQQPLPVSKEMVIKQYKRAIDQGSLDYFSINPARIVVTENAAVVDYYFSYEATFKDNEESETLGVNGQYVEFYVKEGGKWLMLGDMTTINYE